MRRGLLRVLRVSIGLALAGAALAVIVFEQMAGASAGTVVNARLTTSQAPIAGNLSLSGHALGARVSSGEQIAAIANPRADNTRLRDLTLERRAAAARKTRLADEIAAIDGAVERLRAR
jgi:mRNA-degrading endonuclease toxin of MazEF toxin-antitoxin module